MQIFIKTPDDRTITLEVDVSDTILEIKRKIEDKEGTESKKQRLYFGDKLLNNNQTLGDYNIRTESTFDLTIQSGCCNIL